MRTIASIRSARACLKPNLSADPGPPDIVLDDEADSPVIRVVDDHLVVTYLIDEGEVFGYVNHRDLARAALSVDEFHVLAVENLGAFARASMLRVVPQGPIHAVLLDGNFEASLLLDDILWKHDLADLVGKHLVAALPARDVLAFGDAASPEVVDALVGVVERVSKGGDHLLTRRLYVREDARWRAFGRD